MKLLWVACLVTGICGSAFAYEVNEDKDLQETSAMMETLSEIKKNFDELPYHEDMKPLIHSKTHNLSYAPLERNFTPGKQPYTVSATQSDSSSGRG